MAADDFDLDDFDLDNFDLGDGDFSVDPEKDDRSPTAKVATGFLEGVKGVASDGNFLRRMVTDALPDGYRMAADSVDDIVDSGRRLYDTAAAEVRPAAHDIRRLTKRLLPHVKRYMPDSVADKIEGHLKEHEEKEDVQKADFDELSIASSIEEIFKAKQRAEDSIRAEDTTKEYIKDTVEKKRFSQTLSQQDSIREGINRLVGYQDQVTANFQKKTLELQYRHFFAARDLLEYFKASAADTKANLQAIAKNTALPEFAKIQLSETSSQLLRQRILGGIHETAIDYTSGIRSRFFENLQKRLADGISSARNSLGQLNETAEMMEGVGGSSPTELVGNVAGGLATNWLGGRISAALSGPLARNERIRSLGDNLGYYAENRDQLFADWANLGESDDSGLFGRADTALGSAIGKLKGEEDSGSDVRIFRRLEGWLKELAPRYDYQSGDLRDDLFKTADEAVIFNKLTQQAITEIIPGYLSHIHHELKIMRTGDTKTDRFLYNYDRQEFTSAGQAKADIAERVLPSSSVSGIQKSLQEFIEVIGADGELSERAREALSRQLLDDTAKGKAFTHDRYSKGDSFQGDLDPNTISEITDYFKRTFQDEDGNFKTDAQTAERRRRAASQVRNLQRDLPNFKEGLTAYANLGQRDLLQHLNLVSRNQGRDQINYADIWSAISGTDQTAGYSHDGETQGDRQNPLLDSLHGSPSSGDGSDGIMAGLFRSFSRTTKKREPRSKKEVVGSDPQIVSLLKQINDKMDVKSKAAKTKGRYDREEEFVLRPEHIQQQTDLLLGGLERFSPKDPLERGVGLLEQILAALKSNKGKGGGYARPRSRLDSLVGKVAGGVGSVTKGLGSLYGQVFSGAGSLFGGGLNLAGGTLRTAGNLLRKGLRASTDFDVYVKGLKFPALYASKLKAGQYRDQLTGKVIRSMKDITGPVVDELGNVVLRAEDLAKGLVNREGMGLLSKSFDFVSNIYKNVYGAPLGMVGRALSTVFGSTKNLIERIRLKDVYIRGEDTPRLLARVLERGGYFSQATGKVIRSIKDIDGTVVDRDGNVVLNLDEMRRGLVDQYGKPFKGLAGRIGSLIRGAGRAAGTVLNAYGKVLGGALDLGKGLLGRFVGGYTSEEGLKAVEQTNSLLVEIRDLLDERLAKPVRGDLSGDGLRDGSWQSQFAKRDEKTETEPEPEKPSDSFGLGGLKSLLSMFSLFGGGGEKESGDTYIDASGRGGKKSKAKGKGKGGRLRRLGRGIKGLGGRAARLATGVGGRVAATAALSTGVIGTAASAVGTGLAAIGAVLSAPVVLAGLAVAAVGAGGYLLYKHLSRVKLTPFDTLRYLQYGIDPNSKKKESLQKVIYLEKELWKELRFSAESGASLTLSDRRAEELAKGFGANLEDEGELRTFVTWFNHRFKQVFLTHATVANDLAKGTELLDLTDKLTAAEKLEYIRRIKFGTGRSGPYYVYDNPFTGLQSLVPPSRIEDAIASAEALYRKEAVKAGSEDTKAVTPGSAEESSRKTAIVDKALLDAPVRRSELNSRFGPTDSPDDPEVKADLTEILKEGSLPPQESSNDRRALNELTLPLADIPINNTVSGPVEQADDNIEQRKRKLERDAAALDAQQRRSNDILTRSMGNVENYLRRSYDTQRSMDSSLKSMNRLLETMNRREEVKDPVENRFELLNNFFRTNATQEAPEPRPLPVSMDRND